MLKSANHEVLLVLPTINAFYRKERIGIMELLKQAAEKEHGVNVRILTPTKVTIEEKLQDMVHVSDRRDSKREKGKKYSNKLRIKRRALTYDIWMYNQLMKIMGKYCQR
jgi:hypothetical protein